MLCTGHHGVQCLLVVVRIVYQAVKGTSVSKVSFTPPPRTSQRPSLLLLEDIPPLPTNGQREGRSQKQRSLLTVGLGFTY